MEELYKDLKAKHDLPDYGLMDKEFEISAIEDETFVLREIRKTMAEKIDASLKFLDNLFHPDPGFANYREAELFNDKDREDMVSIYRRLMFFKRGHSELTLEDSDTLNGRFINDFMAEWPNLKSKLLVYVKKMKESWQQDMTKKEVVGYLG